MINKSRQITFYNYVMLYSCIFGPNFAKYKDTLNLLEVQVMRRTILTLLAGIALLAAATSASAYTVSGVDIGGLDSYISSTNLGNSGVQAEVDWVNDALSTYYEGKVFSFTTADLRKYDTPGGSEWVETDQYTDNTKVVAFNLETTPQFYFVKTGKVGSNNHFLFANNESLDWAVLNLDTSFGDGYIISGIGKFSHNGELGGAPVPEPGTVILLGAGLIGLAAYGRKRSKK
jgi:hypothetical protein